MASMSFSDWKLDQIQKRQQERDSDLKRWMVDIESLGDQPGGVILSIGWVRFGVGVGPYMDTAKEARIDIDNSIRDGFRVNSGPVNFWLHQPRPPWGKCSHFLTIKDAIQAVYEDLAGADQVWAKPPSYDLNAIRHAGERYGLTPTWTVSSQRCLRELLKGNRVPGNLIPPNTHRHGALSDAVHQAWQCSIALERKNHANSILVDSPSVVV